MSKERHMGYLLIDNRASGHGLQESKTFTCNHCNRVVIMNAERTRERGYCRGCDRYLCDECGTVRAITGQCKTFNQVIDEVLATAEQQTAARPTSLLLP